jgi:hypothetical protein
VIYYPSAEALANNIPPEGADLAADFIEAGKQFVWPAELIASICFRESLFGEALSPRGAWGTGDWTPGEAIGHGRGLMQIDDRPHLELGQVAVNWLQEVGPTGVLLWKDAGAYIQFGAFVLSVGRAMLDWTLARDAGLMAHVCGYNADLRKILAAVRAGADPNLLTSGRNYGTDVVDKARTWHALGKNGHQCDCALCTLPA